MIFSYLATSTWLNAFSADACVPDAYANTSASQYHFFFSLCFRELTQANQWYLIALDQAENFAQETVVEQYYIVDSNTLPTEAIPGCLSNQRSAIDSNFRTTFMTPGGTCQFRYANSPPYITLVKRQTPVTSWVDTAANEAAMLGIHIISLATQSTFTKVHSDRYYPFGKPSTKMIRGMRWRK